MKDAIDQQAPDKQTPLEQISNPAAEEALLEVMREKTLQQDTSTASVNESMIEILTVKWFGGKEYTPEETWIFLWSECQNWPGLQRHLRNSFGEFDPLILWDIEKSKLDLVNSSGGVVGPTVWETLARPGWEVQIRFRSHDKFQGDDVSSDKVPSEAEDGITEEGDEQPTDSIDDFVGELELEAKAQYKLRVVDRYDRVYREETFDFPPIFGQTKMDVKMSETLPVLEEKISVTRARRGTEDDYYVNPEEAMNVLSGYSDSGDLSKRVLIGKGYEIVRGGLKIHSPLLLNALRTVMRYSSSPPSGDDDLLQDGNFAYPYRDLFYHKDDLRQYKLSNRTRERHTSTDNEQCDLHIDVLVEFLRRQTMIIDLDTIEKKWEEGITPFSAIWLLLKPGCDAYVQEDGTRNGYVVESIQGGDSEFRIRHYLVNVWNLTFDGDVVTRKSKYIKISVFDGDRDITSLPILPAHFVKDEASLRSSLTSRGLQYMKLVKGPTFQEYTGKGAAGKEYEGARVVVDHNRDGTESSYYFPDGDIAGERARVPGCECSECKAYRSAEDMHPHLTFSDYDKIDPNDDINPETGVNSKLTLHHFFLCNSRLWGYVLKDREYDVLFVDSIQEVRIVTDAIDRLVMKTESNKDLLKAICKAYTSGHQQDKPFYADFIRGKGEGQIVLLHGPPGTESVAESTRRPLLSITAADLGHEPVQLEKNLLTFFRNANDWGAIVLLDEADIYLERRRTSDLERNSVVSIFLRALDYFEGILFLTTNRVGSFDEAFLSRIHVQIGYDPLTDDARQKIWQNHFDKLENNHEQGCKKIDIENYARMWVQEIQQVLKLQWNGREIRNAFSTAVALALYESQDRETPKVKQKHLEAVAKMSSAFKDYVISTHGADQSVLAYRNNLRDDKIKHDT